MPLDRITILCFGSSYAVALILELVLLLRPRPVFRYVAILFGAMGLSLHTVFLATHRLALASQTTSLVFLAWILAMFYLYGSIHYRRLAWGLFVLPVVVGILALAQFLGSMNGAAEQSALVINPVQFWQLLHVGLFLLAAVGVCVAFVASVMYLVQAQRLKAKLLPGKGIRLLSLERLENMNRRGINWAFPLLTIGLIVGLVLMAQENVKLQGWTDPQVLGTIVLWLVFVIVFYLRYGFHLGGRRVALLTIMAFALLLVTLVTTHQHRPGGIP